MSDLHTDTGDKQSVEWLEKDAYIAFKRVKYKEFGLPDSRSEIEDQVDWFATYFGFEAWFSASCPGHCERTYSSEVFRGQCKFKETGPLPSNGYASGCIRLIHSVSWRMKGESLSN